MTRLTIRLTRDPSPGLHETKETQPEAVLETHAPDGACVDPQLPLLGHRRLLPGNRSRRKNPKSMVQRRASGHHGVAAVGGTDAADLPTGQPGADRPAAVEVRGANPSHLLPGDGDALPVLE